MEGRQFAMMAAQGSDIPLTVWVVFLYSFHTVLCGTRNGMYSVCFCDIVSQKNVFSSLLKKPLVAVDLENVKIVWPSAGRLVELLQTIDVCSCELSVRVAMRVSRHYYFLYYGCYFVLGGENFTTK